jgi:hypothetical protein
VRLAASETAPAPGPVLGPAVQQVIRKAAQVVAMRQPPPRTNVLPGLSVDRVPDHQTRAVELADADVVSAAVASAVSLQNNFGKGLGFAHCQAL